MKCLLSLLVAQSMAEKVESSTENKDAAPTSFKGSHLDDIEYLENFKWDKVKFMTRKDCALDPYPAVSILEF